jgi:hypothetical protein
MSELEATEDTRTRLNAYLYKRMDTNKVGVWKNMGIFFGLATSAPSPTFMSVKRQNK